MDYEGDRWRWVGGLYAAYEDLDAHFDRRSFSFRDDRSRSSQQTTNLAVFGEVTYEFVPTWKATLGGRLDYTTQETSEFFSRAQPLGTAPVVLTDFTAEFDEINFLPKGWNIQGFRRVSHRRLHLFPGLPHGGSGYDRVNAATYTFEPEKASTYEFFYKGRFLDERLTLNANVFYTDFSDQQVEVRTNPLDALSSRIVNAASSRSYGFEFEPNFDVTDQFSAFVSLGYVNTRFEEFNDASLGDLAGLPFPEVAGMVGGHRRPLCFRQRRLCRRRRETYVGLSGAPGHAAARLPNRDDPNLQAGYKRDSWEINVFAENVLDERYFLYNDNDFAATLGERRTFGINAKARF